MTINQGDRLSISELKFGLKNAVKSGLQLAIFNSCDGLALARDLAELQIPQVIVMREPVPDRVAQTFLQYFLTAFSQETSLHLALRHAREQLQGLEQQFPCATWLPVLFQNPTAIPLTWPKTSDKKRPILRALAASLLISCTTIALRHSQLLQPLELPAFDHLLQLKPDEPKDNRILVITITEADVQAQSKIQGQRQGSLSDAALQKLTTQLRDARVIGLDVYRDYPAKLPALKKWLQEDDRFVAVCQVSDPEQSDNTGIAPPPEVVPENVGFSDALVDRDRIQRRHLIAMDPTAGACPAETALSTQLALRYLVDQSVSLQPTKAGLNLGKVPLPLIKSHWGGYQNLDDRGYQILLNYRHNRTVGGGIHQVTLQEVLDGKVNEKFIRDRIVLIGTTAPSFKDQAPTPYGGLEVPGVVIQAQMTSQLVSAVLDGRSLLRVWPMWGDYLWIVGWGFVGVVAGRRWWVVGGGMGVLYGLSWGLLGGGGYWVPLVPGALALVGGAMAARRSIK